MPIVHAISILYRELYRIGRKLSKRDRFGIHNEAERTSLILLTLAIDASIQPLSTKIEPIQSLRRQVEILKHLLRIEQELNIIDSETYWRLQEQLQETSKMAVGWEKFVHKKRT